MKQRESIFLHFILFFFLSVGVFGLFNAKFFFGVKAIFERAAIPIQRYSYLFFHVVVSQTFADSKNKELENRKFLEQMHNQKIFKLQKENQALLDQFQTQFPKSQDLIPAHIIGAPEFIPNKTSPSVFIIDRGKKDHVVLGLGVVFKDNIVGKIIKVSERISVVQLVTNSDFSIPVRTQKTHALGIIRGKGNGELVLDSVVASDDLLVSDLVVTNGDIDEEGNGLPQDIVVGEIVSIDKKPSSIFQTAKIDSLLNFQKLTMVFIVNKK